MDDLTVLPDDTSTQKNIDELVKEYKLTTSNGFHAVDFENTARELNQGIEYVNESRSEFEKGGPQKWITDLVNLLEQTLKMVRELEIEHIDDSVEYIDNTGEFREVITHMQDPRGVEKLTQLYTKSMRDLDAYLNKHITLIRQQTGVRK